jgi:hypothetical protein
MKQAHLYILADWMPSHMMFHQKTPPHAVNALAILLLEQYPNVEGSTFAYMFNGSMKLLKVTLI